MPVKKGGVKRKEAAFDDNFNSKKKLGASPAELREMARKKKNEDNKRRAKEKRMLKLQEELDRLKAESGEEGDAASGSESNDDESAYKMLMDMRHIYRTVKGRKRLQEMVLDDPKQFGFLVKELLKIETALMAAKIRSKESGVESGMTTFVILKGLENEKDIVAMHTQGNKTIDVTQISDAVNPTTEQKIEREDESIDWPEPEAIH